MVKYPRLQFCSYAILCYGIAFGMAINQGPVIKRSVSEIPIPALVEHSNTSLNLSRNDLECLAQNIYYESRGESTEGQVAVGMITINRMKSPRYPKSVCGVVYSVVVKATRKSCAFSWVCDDYKRPIEPGAWAKAQKIAEKINRGKIKNNVGDSTYFCRTGTDVKWDSYVIPYKTIGNHTFYMALI